MRLPTSSVTSAKGGAAKAESDLTGGAAKAESDLTGGVAKVETSSTSVAEQKSTDAQDEDKSAQKPY